MGTARTGGMDRLVGKSPSTLPDEVTLMSVGQDDETHRVLTQVTMLTGTQEHKLV